MQKKISKVCFFLFAIMLVSCGPAMLPQSPTPITTVEDSLFMTAQMGSTLSAMLTQTAELCTSCSVEDVYLTLAMATAFASTPSNTPPPGVTIIPAAGDLGWGSVSGRIIDGASMQPLEGVMIRCEHYSYATENRCKGVVTTKADGAYAFAPVFLHDTDRITLVVEATGYQTLRFEESFITQTDVHIDLGLFPIHSPTPSPTPSETPSPLPPPVLMCTPPACSNGVLACGLEAGCPGGCGTVCLLPTPTP